MNLFREEVSEHRKARLDGDVILSQPLSTRVMVSATFAAVAVAAIWVVMGSYARIETVPGILSTDIPSAKVVAIQPGVVIKLNIADGQLVRAGDPLAVISLDRRVAEGDSVASQSLVALDEQKQIAHSQVGLSGRRTTAERQRLATIIAAAEQQGDSIRQQIILQEQLVASNQNLIDQITSVVERGFVSKVEFERRRQTLINSQQLLAGLRQQLLARLADAGQARAQINSLMAESEQGVAEIQSRLQAMAQQEAQLEGERGYVISAPISGRVTAMQTAVGRTVSSNIPLMVVIPENSRLKAELFAPTRAMGFVKPGQETRILYDAFPYQRFGSFGGRVQSVSRIVIDPRESEVALKLDEAAYRVTVVLDRQSVAAYGEQIALQPGMTLQANIVLERQSFLSWLLKPISAVLNRTA